MKTRAEFFRDAKANKITLELIERFKNRDIAENMQGKRTISKVQSNGVYLMNKDGRKSFLELAKASLMEYTGDELRIYNAGYREMTDKEKQVMKEWEAITNTEDYKRQAQIDAMSDGSSTYYAEKRFFTDKKMEYLMGVSNGAKNLIFSKYYNGEKECIRDENVKGEVILVYRVERA